MFLLLACSPALQSPPSVPAPVAWYDTDGSLDLTSLRPVGDALGFRAAGAGVHQVALDDSFGEGVACDGPTRVSVVFAEGVLVQVRSEPATPCVERRLRTADWRGVRLGERLVSDTRAALLVFDVPAERMVSR